MNCSLLIIITDKTYKILNTLTIFSIIKFNIIALSWLVVYLHAHIPGPRERSSEPSDTGSPVELEPDYHVRCSAIHSRFSRNSMPRANSGPHVCEVKAEIRKMGII